jgi:hypothetical protein
MRAFFAALLILHGLIHLMGPAKAFGVAALPQLRPISKTMGLMWLLAATLFIGAGIGLYVWPRGWWAVVAIGALISEGLIVRTWAAAKFGTALNLAVLVGAFFGLHIDGPLSLRAQFEEQVDWQLARFEPGMPVAESDLAWLPAPVRHYLDVTGAARMGPPQNMYVRMHGRIRSSPDAAWMPFVAEQYNTFFRDRARLFYMELSDGRLAVQGFHRYAGAVADMHVYVAGLIPVARAGGEDMTRSETVTMLNDMAMLAPGALLDSSIQWTPVDDCTVTASFENAMMRVQATLEFNDAGDLVSFESGDRRQLGPGGTTFTHARWSTPLDRYRAFGSIRLASHGEARWHTSESSYSYVEVSIDDIQYNVRARVVR